MPGRNVIAIDPKSFRQPVEVYDRALGPCLQLSNLFQMQSFFDSTAYHQAIVPQTAPIAALVTTTVGPQTITDLQFPGNGLALHPSSQTPIAVSVKGRGGAVGGSGVFVLAPGEIIYPLGMEPFEAFRWGLPYGWLGGGVASLLVVQTPRSSSQTQPFSARPEIVFHRQRIPILRTDTTEDLASNTTSGNNINSLPISNAPNNWPTRFPWINSFAAPKASSTGIPQGANPVIAVEPTRTILRLMSPTPGTVPTGWPLAAPATMRILMQGMDDFDLDFDGGAGDVQLKAPTFQDVTWPSFSTLGTTGSNLTKIQYPVLSLDASNILTRLGANLAGPMSALNATAPTVLGGVVFLDASGANLLDDLVVDVIRYGRI